MAAKNFDEAELPEPVKRFISDNATSLLVPYRSYDCKGGKSVDISDMYSPADHGSKNMVTVMSIPGFDKRRAADGFVDTASTQIDGWQGPFSSAVYISYFNVVMVRPERFELPTY